MKISDFPCFICGQPSNNVISRGGRPPVPMALCKSHRKHFPDAKELSQTSTILDFLAVEEAMKS